MRRYKHIEFFSSKWIDQLKDLKTRLLHIKAEDENFTYILDDLFWHLTSMILQKDKCVLLTYVILYNKLINSKFLFPNIWQFWFPWMIICQTFYTYQSKKLFNALVDRGWLFDQSRVLFILNLYFCQTDPKKKII